ncbi:glutamine-hydrolyzing GMP synthase [Anaplasmataceae bacterium AB001_6]|nr:glutamine-hydrolyzing GMP synthase [Anaplasmataceae bacterium AB001_6]
MGLAEHILVIDFGSQFTSLIARRIRDLNSFSIVVTPDNFNFQAGYTKGIILSGGYNSVNDIDFSPLLNEILKINKSLQIPVLGICFGHQCLSRYMGGTIHSSDAEYGLASVNVNRNSKLISDIAEKNFNVWMSHGDSVVHLPDDLISIAGSINCENVIVSNEERNIYGIQFHPEVHHTENGEKILENFLSICQVSRSWNAKILQSEIVNDIKRIVGKSKVLAAVSGGVDSSVSAALVSSAIGDNLRCIFVDTGLLRKNERQNVEESLRNNFNINLEVIDAKEEFLSVLKGVSDPEKKRKIIGEKFISIFESVVKEEEFLLQGTVYPDLIESGKSGGAKIKSHHNVGGLPEKMNLKILEPMRMLFKDEVRRIGAEIGLPHDLLWRHPFPGPGLAVRIPGEITEEKINILQEIDEVYISALKKENLYDKIWQAFAILLPVRSVGVMGDGRSYGYSCVLRAISSVDGMTADVVPFNFKDDVEIIHMVNFLKHISNEIVNKVKGVNRVLFDITSKPPGTIEWE